jgi:type VI secretion system protein ImpG
MPDDLFSYYEEELLTLRRLCDAFAVRHPEAAGRLQLQPGWGSADPHVERLIEAFALIAARIHRRLDDGFPEIVHALLDTLYPHYLAPIPSVLIVQCVPTAGLQPPPTGTRIERHTRLRSPPVDNTPCRFRTAYPVTLWPVRVVSAALVPPPFDTTDRPPEGTAAALTIRLERSDQDAPLAALPLEHLRFYLCADPRVAVRLYELLFRAASRVVFRTAGTESVVLAPAECLRPVGFAPDEGLFPYPPQAFIGYRLLTELFAFPNKFLFFDLGKLDRLRGAGARGLEVTVYLREWDPIVYRAIRADTFRLGCAPAVNLFEQVAEAIDLDHTRHEYPVVPDATRPDGTEVYSVDSVSGFDRGTGRAVAYHRMYSVEHPRNGAGTPNAFWLTHRRLSARPDDPGTDVFLRLFDLSFSPLTPTATSLIVRATCSNRHLPAELGTQSREVVFEVEGPSPPGAVVRGLTPPTPRVAPPTGREAYWRLISHLNLNHLTIAPADHSPSPLQELLRLYDFTVPGYRPDLWLPQRLIGRIRSVTSRRVTERLGDGPDGFARGVEVTVEFDEDQAADGGIFLFGAVLDRFLGTYASINAFVVTVVRLHPSGRSYRWKPRAGTQPLL